MRVERQEGGREVIQEMKIPEHLLVLTNMRYTVIRDKVRSEMQRKVKRDEKIVKKTK